MPTLRRRRWLIFAFAVLLALPVGCAGSPSDGAGKPDTGAPVETASPEDSGDCVATGAESCDGLDNDCDGATDEPDAEGCETWHLDADGDGYGTSETVCLCAAAAPYTSDDDSDCNDASAAHNPGDGSCGPRGGIDVDRATATFHAASGYVKGGYAVDGAGDINGDGALDLVLSAPDTSTSAGCNGVTYVVLGPTEGKHLFDELDAAVSCVAGDGNLGYSLKGGGDPDGDGFPDLLLGVGGGPGPTRAWLVSGPLDGDHGVSEVGQAMWVDESASTFGAFAGDADEDGFDDVWVGLTFSRVTPEGAVFLVRGPVSAGVNLASEADARINGGEGDENLGSDVAGTGDLSGDGVPDMVASGGGGIEVDTADGSMLSGGAWLFLGPQSGDRSVADADATRYAEGENYGLVPVATDGDVNGDGYADLLMGTPGRPSSEESIGGAAWLLYGPLSGIGDMGDAAASVVATDDDEVLIGRATGLIADLDGDGTDEPVVSGHGLYWLFYGPVSGSLDITASSAQFGYRGDEERSPFATTDVASPGDIDQDGTPDLLFGSGQEVHAEVEGYAYLLSGVLDR